jgi:flagellar operon protein
VIETIDPIRTGQVQPVAGSIGDLIPASGSGPPSSPDAGSQPAKAGPSFRDTLAAAADERSLQISGHALNRIEQRQIPLDDGQLDRLSKAMDTLGQRGSRQSLVMLDQVAYVVHVPSHTVVTAVQPDQSKERVFTQIDSVVIA